jgi:hypothetical protein
MRTCRIGKLDLDQPRLLKELERIVHFEYSTAYSDYLCGGPWKSCMLWAAGGNAGDGFITNYDGGKPSGRTEYAEQLPYLTEVIERSFNLKYLTFARLAVISNSVIIPHKDLLEYGKVLHRVHVPLITNDECFFSESNVVYRMGFSEVWFFDAGSMHSAASFSEQDRVHLMLDFVDVDDPTKLMNFEIHDRGIPQESIRPRGALTDEEREALFSLADVIDIENYRDIFSIVIKKHYRKDGGDNFIWNTMREIAKDSRNRPVDSRITEMYQYFMVQRAA